MVILDTHIWLWWINQDTKLKTVWLECIEQADQVGISAISLFEVSWLVKHNRIGLSCSLGGYPRTRIETKIPEIL